LNGHQHYGFTPVLLRADRMAIYVTITWRSPGLLQALNWPS